uniref:beta-N-acetylhexosaminidase n=1 Tax=Timema cristinae TaxID=61476 RepID=A0A7R9CD67_TIMCR|nr:unnamed protein product [Timema cristinae]
MGECVELENPGYVIVYVSSCYSPRAGRYNWLALGAESVLRFSILKMVAKYSQLLTKRGLFFGMLVGSVFAIYFWGRLEDFTDVKSLPRRKLLRSTWTWSCEQNQCVRHMLSEQRRPRVSLATCTMQCGALPLWPRPTGHTELSTTFSKFRLDHLQVSSAAATPKVTELLDRAGGIFLDNLKALSWQGRGRYQDEVHALEAFQVKLSVSGSSSELEPYLTLKTDEGYRLTVRKHGKTLHATVTSGTFFGARHGLETLSQMIWYDEEDDSRVLRVLDNATIDDRPVFPHRGLMIDTSRNFLPLSSIMLTIDGMAASKLNTLHWHMTDSQSFPFDSPRVPQMAQYGAYSFDETYSSADVSSVVEHARVRGVRVLVEIDAPAHAGVGWQWGPISGKGNLTLCVNYQPWRMYCGQPPCGQLNPVNDHTYKVLGDLYADLVELTRTTDEFHMGGDEVDLNCWAAHKDVLGQSPKAKENPQETLMELWGSFQVRALERLKVANRHVMPKAVIVWSSELTKPKYLTREIMTIFERSKIFSTGEPIKFKAAISNQCASAYDSACAVELEASRQLRWGSGPLGAAIWAWPTGRLHDRVPRHMGTSVLCSREQILTMIQTTMTHWDAARRRERGVCVTYKICLDHGGLTNKCMQFPHRGGERGKRRSISRMRTGRK